MSRHVPLVLWWIVECCLAKNPLDRYASTHRSNRLLDFGGGIQVSITDLVDVFGPYMKSLAGRNTHALDRALSIGASWSFGGRSLGGLVAPTAPASPPAESASAEGTRRLVKCLCQKG